MLIVKSPVVALVLVPLMTVLPFVLFMKVVAFVPDIKYHVAFVMFMGAVQATDTLSCNLIPPVEPL